MEKLPTIAEIVSSELTKGDKGDAITVLLNQPPPASWIKKNAFAGNSEYLPIDKTEYLLTKIFKDWFVEVKHVQMIGNSVECTVRLYYRPIIDELWEAIQKATDDRRTELLKIYYTRKREDWYNWQDGTGAAAIQVDAGEKASAFDKIKPYGVAIACPKAESVAISDASDKIGKIFGKDLNRKDIINYNFDDKKFEGAKITEK